MIPPDLVFIGQRYFRNAWCERQGERFLCFNIYFDIKNPSTAGFGSVSFWTVLANVLDPDETDPVDHEEAVVAPQYSARSPEVHISRVEVMASPYYRKRIYIKTIII